MIPTLEESASASWCSGSPTTSATLRSATSSSSTRPRARRRTGAASRHGARPGLRGARPDEADETNFIKRVVATPGDELYIEDGHAIVNGEPIEDDFIKPCGATADGCNLREPITIPRRSLLHDGRQPWSQRRQPLLGTRPERLDHRQGLRHLLAARPNRDLLALAKRRLGQAATGAVAPTGAAPTWLFRFDQQFGHRFVAGADEAGRGSLAGPLVAAGRPARLRLPRARRSARRSPASTTPSARPRRSASALYPAVLAAASAGRGDRALRRRDRLARAPRDQPERARRLPRPGGQFPAPSA